MYYNGTIVLSYLDIEAILAAARETGAQAIHPGYGFLSENPLLAEICQLRNIRFIGPDSEVIHKMGDKIMARQTMIDAGVPVVPGSEGNLSDIEEALALAEDIGYPVMLKATSGGGLHRADHDDTVEQVGGNFL